MHVHINGLLISISPVTYGYFKSLSFIVMLLTIYEIYYFDLIDFYNWTITKKIDYNRNSNHNNNNNK